MGVWDSSDLVTQSFAKDSSVAVEIKRCSGARKMDMGSSSWIRGDLIGAGAFGKVNLALNRENGELFAVKSIECNERNTSEMQAMKNEVEILSSLDSPHVIKCLGSSYSLENGKSMHNVFVEYMSGGSLADLMKKFGGHFDEPLIRNYTRSILEGIQYLHKQEIVHCDIKGKNVLVGSSGVKLADFGAAKRMSDSSVVDSQLTMKGTPLWMAPEVVSLAEQGPASDIWSLGCTVLEMATGKAPWIHIANGAANPFVALYHIHRSEEVPELPSCLSEQAHDFLRKCFQRDPRVRSTAEELLKHPFIVESYTVQEECKPERPQTSPTSTLDFPSQQHDASGYTSSIVNSVPILRSPLFAKRVPQAAGPLSNFQSEEPKQQGTSTSSSSADWWCNSPLSPMPGQWIVVRSPKASSPSSCEAPKLSCGEEQQQQDEEVEVVALKECNLPVIAQEEVAVEPEFASCATDFFQEEQLAEDSETFTGTSRFQKMESHSVQISDVVMVEECEASSSDDEECMDFVEMQKQDNVRVTMSITNPCSTVGEDAGYSDCARHTSGLSSSSNSHLGKLSISIQHLLSNLTRCVIDSTRPQSFKLASLRASLRKLATAHRKMTSRGHRGRPPLLLRLTLRKEVHELVFEKLSSLGGSLRTYSSIRLTVPKGIASDLETFDTLQPQFLRNKLFLNKSATPWWLLYKTSVFRLLFFSGWLCVERWMGGRRVGSWVFSSIVSGFCLKLALKLVMKLGFVQLHTVLEC